MAKIKRGNVHQPYNTRARGRSVISRKNTLALSGNGKRAKGWRSENTTAISSEDKRRTLLPKVVSQSEHSCGKEIQSNNDNNDTRSSLNERHNESSDSKTNGRVESSQLGVHFTSYAERQPRPCHTINYCSTKSESSECMSLDEDYGVQLRAMANNGDHDRVQNYDTMDSVAYTCDSTMENSVYSYSQNNSSLSVTNGHDYYTNGSNSDLNNLDKSSLQNGVPETLRACPLSSTRSGYRFRTEYFSDLSKSFPPTQPRKKVTISHLLTQSEHSLSADTDLEKDVFYAQNVYQETFDKSTIPAGVPAEFNRLGEYRRKLRNSVWPGCWGKQLCDEVYINHPYSTDGPLGDRFGASIWTVQKKQGYFRHFFTKVQQHTPAQTMQIRDDDEIVLINAIFVPDLDHEAVLKLISKVPVDCETRFQLILRRQDKNEAEWNWIETSAILVPELPSEPKAIKVHTVPLRNNMYDSTTYHRYKIIGTQLYIGITSGRIIVDVLTGNRKIDDTKTLRKHAIACQDPKDPIKLRFLVSLSSEDNRNFVALNERTNDAILKATEEYFEYRKIGSDISFKWNDVYLTFENNKLCGTREEQMFTEMPTPGHRDIYDTASHTGIDIDMDELDGAKTSICGTPDGANTLPCCVTNGETTPPCRTSTYRRDSGYTTSSQGNTPPRNIMTRALSKQLSMTSGLEKLCFD